MHSDQIRSCLLRPAASRAAAPPRTPRTRAGVVVAPEPTAHGPEGGHPGGREAGSLVTEYGLIAIVGATLAGLAIRWASGGAVVDLFGAILERVESVVGL